MNICPQKAISMVEDEYGFSYPQIDNECCVKCEACKTVCGFQNVTETNSPIVTYASAMKNETEVLASASGGIFVALAKAFLADGGIVFGVSMEYINGLLTPMHISINNINDLYKLQGSKYVQSYIGEVSCEVKRYLIEGKKVLFSGTPCQVAGLKAFLKRDYKNLLTIDIICHGVPNIKFFQGYIKHLEKKLKGKIIKYKFRDKKKGWGLSGKVVYKTEVGKVKEKLIPCNVSSYYSFFLSADIYRENCYSCKYSSSHRPGDITIGDYWGVQKEHPEIMEENGGILSEIKGISCIIVNTEKGKEYLSSYGFELILFPSEFEKAARKNSQLNTPSCSSKFRDDILMIFKTQGYDAVEKYFRNKMGIKYYYHVLNSKIPQKLKKKIKKKLCKIKLFGKII
ncbi:coenzyme F420 hydrogenase [Clostridium beijerinckii]|nr:coenzyme F420 hydrogenase [Clostridium beijerinckii]